MPSFYLESMAVVGMAFGLPTLIVVLCLALTEKTRRDYDEIRELAKFFIIATVVATLLGPITLAGIGIGIIGVILFGIYRVFRG